MEKDLIEFMKNIEDFDNENYTRYKDEKGNEVLLPKIKLLCNCEYLEMTKAQYNKAMYEQVIDNKTELKTKMGKTYADKYQITHKAEDKGTITEVETKLYLAWVVSNGIGVRHTFSNKEDALNFLHIVNAKYLYTLERGD